MTALRRRGFESLLAPTERGGDSTGPRAIAANRPYLRDSLRKESTIAWTRASILSNSGQGR